MLAFVGFALASTFTIDIPTADEARVKEAYGSILGLGRPATVQEIENAVTLWLESSTQDYERRKNMAQFTPPPMNVAKDAHAAASASPTPAFKKK